MDKGLFRLSRHPNCFGETLVAWSFWLTALDAGSTGLLTVFAPVLMTWLLLRVSGVTMLDEHLRATKPGYVEYMARTSAFVPWPRRRVP